MSNVRQTSIDAFYNMSLDQLTGLEIKLLSHLPPGVKLSRQDIEAKSLENGDHIPINTISGRVTEMLKKGSIVEDGKKLGDTSGQWQNLLRRFDPKVDMHPGDPRILLLEKQGKLFMLHADCHQFKVSYDGEDKLISFGDGDMFQRLKAIQIDIYEAEILRLTKIVNDRAGKTFVSADD